MALQYKKVKDAIEKAPLTSEELKLIDSVEKFIDTEINTKFKGDEIFIDLTIAHFNYDMANHKSINLAEVRKNLMRKELEKRYKEAGWKVRLQFDDGLDGPNFSGPDYWILSGKGR